MPLFDEVDLLEQNTRFLDASVEYVASPKLKGRFNLPVQACVLAHVHALLCVHCPCCRKLGAGV